MGNCLDCKNNIEGSGELTDGTFITCRKIQKAIPIEMIKGHSLFNCKYYEKNQIKTTVKEKMKCTV